MILPQCDNFPVAVRYRPDVKVCYSRALLDNVKVMTHHDGSTVPHLKRDLSGVPIRHNLRKGDTGGTNSLSVAILTDKRTIVSVQKRAAISDVG